jgi:hypothetical protein
MGQCCGDARKKRSERRQVLKHEWNVGAKWFCLRFSKRLRKRRNGAFLSSRVCTTNDNMYHSVFLRLTHRVSDPNDVGIERQPICDAAFWN